MELDEEKYPASHRVRKSMIANPRLAHGFREIFFSERATIVFEV